MEYRWEVKNMDKNKNDQNKDQKAEQEITTPEGSKGGKSEGSVSTDNLEDVDAKEPEAINL